MCGGYIVILPRKRRTRKIIYMDAKRTILIVCNWKSEPDTPQQVQELVQGVCRSVGEGQSVLITPPHIFIPTANQYITDARASLPVGAHVLLGAQDIMIDSESASVLTGEVSGDMLVSFGVSHVLVGHSERRHVLGESDDVVQKKLSSVVAHGMIPVLCVGESKRTTPRIAADFCIAQVLHACSKGLCKKLCIAYEPVWEIGGREHIDIEYVRDVLVYIREKLNVDIPTTQVTFLYGGSVRCETALELIHACPIEGLLIGSASLDVGAFSCILKSVYS